LAKAGFVDKNPNFPCYIAPDFLQYLCEDTNQKRPNQKKGNELMKTRNIAFTMVPLLLSCFALSLIARADPPLPITQVIGGLHSPRGLAFGPGGQLFVAQAGDDTVNGSIIEILNPMAVHPLVRTTVSGLPVTGEEGEFVGVDGISIFGNGVNFGLYAIMAVDPQQTGDPAFGNLLRLNYRNQVQTLVNVGSFDYDWTADHTWLVPFGDFPDANPYGVLVLAGHIYVVDAGANTLNEVMPDGSIRILAFFPNGVFADATPTCACQGPDGFLYIGTLALVDSFFLGPSAKVYRLNPADANLEEPWNSPMTVWASELWPINGCTFGSDSNFYASQLFTNPDILNDFDNPEGDVVQIPFNSPSTHTFLTGGALSFTGGVAVGPNNVVYVADGTAFVPEGRIVRLGR
jgi:hypothetical protein